MDPLQTVPAASGRAALLVLTAWALGTLPGIQDRSMGAADIHRRWKACQESRRSGKPQATADLLAPLLEMFPNNPIYLSLAAETETRLHRPSKAAALWERYINVAPLPTDACPQDR